MFQPLIEVMKRQQERQATCPHKKKITTKGGDYEYRTACRDCGKLVDFRFKANKVKLN